jgi:alpha-amylase
VRRPNRKFIDLTGHHPQAIVTNGDGWGCFTCPAGSVSVWVEA